MNDKTQAPAQIVMPVDLANRILAYLGSRPYIEVFQLIQEIQQLPPLTEAK